MNHNVLCFSGAYCLLNTSRISKILANYDRELLLPPRKKGIDIFKNVHTCPTFFRIKTITAIQMRSNPIGYSVENPIDQIWY